MYAILHWQKKAQKILEQTQSKYGDKILRALADFKLVNLPTPKKFILLQIKKRKILDSQTFAFDTGYLI